MPPEHVIPTSQHKRAKSSVLKSFLHKRTPSEGSALPTPNDFVASPDYGSMPMPFLPQDHPHSKPLGELHQNYQSQQPASPKKSKDWGRTPSDDGVKSLHKKTLSSISLKSLTGKDTDKTKESRPSKPKKTKSSTNLATLLSRPKSSRSLRKQAKEEEAKLQKDKENRKPSSSPIDTTRPPPIYSQFSSDYFAKQQFGGKFLEDEIDLYTPQQYSPGKQRDFYYGQQQHPSLTRKVDGTERPKSTYLPSNFSLQDISRRVSGGSRHSSELARRLSEARRPSLDRKSTATSATSATSDKSAPQKAKKLMAAVPSFSAKQKVPERDRSCELQDRDIEKEFEAMLDRRNIPEHQRGKMRNLALSMKKDFVKQDWAEIEAAKNGRPSTKDSDSSTDVISGTYDASDVKPKRPRSRTFTLSRASSKEPSSPTKKSKATFGRTSRSNSTESLRDAGKKTLTSSGGSAAHNIIAKAKGQTPNDFVSYLRKVQKPEQVEVGRLHKLRLLLRNETVSWTDEFIGQGGMEEIVGLLHRIMEVEWREEHEDALLHEVLLCLKALSTTALALEHLNKFQPTLFPALIHMLFDEEKKGPSEFTTRNIVTSLLFTYLKMAPLAERSHRAKVLLSYLKDPEPSESQRPVGFVLDMRRDRPYRVWCKEVVNVTKEVFWIFLHNLNVIALPGARGSNGSDGNEHDISSTSVGSSTSHGSFDASNAHHIYMAKHFPPELPPVPAAPYVGGVEWDATNYLASHLDIMNGILACLPTREERNTLREQLLVSGWEKCMGSTLRLCKEKFYGGVHAALRCWVASATEDGWNTRDVRCGPSTEAKSPVRKSPKKGPVQDAPKIDMKLDFLGGGDSKKPITNDGDWL